MNAPAPRTFAFGRFRFDAAGGKLLLDGADVPLPWRERQLLAMLVENADQWLQDDWLSRTLWPKAVPPQGELDRLIRDLRAALDRGADGVATIQSLPGRGHRLLIPVRPLADPAAAAPPRVPVQSRGSDTQALPGTSAHRRWISPRRFALVLVAAAILAGAVGWGLRWATRRAEGVASGAPDARDPAALRVAASAELAKGEAAAREHDLASLNEAISRFEAALAIEPGFAKARAALAVTLIRTRDYWRARREAEAAAALDPKIADAHAALAVARLFVDWNPATARLAAEKALALDVSHVRGRRALAWTYAAEGRFVEARAQILQARSPSGFDVELGLDQARIEFLAGRSAASRRLLAEIVRREPAAIVAHETLASIHLAERRLGAAALELELTDALAAGATRDDERVRLAAIGGWEPPDPGEAARLLRTRAEESASWAAPGGALVAARIFAQFGDRDLALEALERAVAKRESDSVLAWIEPSFAALRATPRFRDLMNRAGIAPPIGDATKPVAE